MDSQYHNLRAHTAEVGATASDTAETGNTVQRLAYRRDLQDDEVSSISDERNEEEAESNRLPERAYVSDEKTPQMSVMPTSHLESNSPGQYEHHSAQQYRGGIMRLKNYAHDWWLFELGALAISYMAMIALVIILKLYENEPVPRWPGHINLNALISVTSTIMKAAIAVPITASISQMKWVWFKERNPIRGMQVFDEASRGPLGALKLLFSKYVLSLASLGALIILLALGMDPFFQQVVSYPLELRVETHVSDSSVAHLPKGSSYNSVRATEKTGDPAAEYAMQQAVYGSLFLGSPKTTAASCSSGNCTWPLFQTLGVCNRCEDVSALIQKSEVPNPDWDADGDTDVSKTKLSYHLPNGLNVTLPNEVFYDEPAIINSNGSTILTQLPMINFTITNMSIMSTTAAYECNVHWCVKEYNSSVSGGVLTEVPLTLDPPLPRFDTYNGTHSWCDWFANDYEYIYYDGAPPIGTPIYRQDPSISNDPDKNCIVKLYTENETFYFTNATQYALLDLLQHVFTGNLTWAGDTILNPSSDTIQTFTTDWSFPKAEPGKPLDPNANRYAAGNITLVNIPELMNNLTESMTVRIRQAAAGLPPPNSTVNGTTYQLQAFVKVRWRWLTLPIIVLFLTAVLLVASIVFTFSTKTKPWKSSATALLFHGLDPERLNQVSGIKKRAQMDQASREITVQLVKTEQGWRLR